MHNICAAILLLPLLSACSSTRSLAATFHSTKHFVPYAADTRILYEPGAEPFIERIPSLLPDAINKVEAGHYSPFFGPVNIYVCATTENYFRQTGHRAPAIVTTHLFLSPDLFRGNKPVDRYLTHELSHLHIRQKLGLVGAFRLPSWFKEGLAELVSGGATGYQILNHDAYKAINEKRSFIPDEGRNIISTFLSPRYGSYWNLEQPMFYRQCMLFVQFMKEYDEKAFQKFLVNVEDGRSFKNGFVTAYGIELSGLWERFVEKSRTSAANQAMQPTGRAGG